MTVTSGPSDPVHFPALTRLGYSARWAALFASVGHADRLVRVVSDHRGALVVSDGEQDLRLETPPDLRPVTGDWLALSGRRIDGILERASALVRTRAGGEPQVLAANVDFVGILHGLDRPLNRRRLERGLVLAWEGGAQPVIILTKADLIADVTDVAREAAATGPGVEVFVTSTVDARGLDDIRQLLRPHRSMALLGASGAGKSSLANALLDTHAMPTQPVRTGDRKGRHTTTHRQLLLMPSGGILLDTPGLRALTIGVATQGIDRTFPEIDALSAGCRFSDCRHDREPGCAVLAAVEAGDLDPDRFEGWRRVQREADSARLRADPIALRRRNRQWGRSAYEDAIRLKRGDQHRGSGRDE